MEKQFKLTNQGADELEAYLRGMSKLGWDLVHLQIVGTANNTWAILHSKAVEYAMIQGVPKDGK